MIVVTVTVVGYVLCYLIDGDGGDDDDDDGDDDD